MGSETVLNSNIFKVCKCPQRDSLAVVFPSRFPDYPILLLPTSPVPGRR